MPEYLAPGVYMEEVSFRAKSIEGVGTSVASIVGPTRTGPLRGIPEVVTSYAEFTRVFGDADDLVFDDDGDDLTVSNYTAHAARAFFDNGGKQLYVSRVVREVNDATADGGGTSAAVAASAGLFAASSAQALLSSRSSPAISARPAGSLRRLASSRRRPMYS